MTRRARLDYHKPVVRQHLIPRAGTLLLVLAVGAGALEAALPAHARAAEPKFMGVEIEPYNGNFVVTTTVNLRAQPKPKGKKLGQFVEDQIIDVVGRIKGGGWYAVMERGKPAGFVYAKAVLPLIDGQLATPLRGVVKTPAGPPCDYEIRFTGHARVDNGPARIADYTADLHCGSDGNTFEFATPMFMTETPYDLRHRDRVFQINVDVLSEALGETDVEDTFSTIFLFNLDTGVVKFDSVTQKQFARGAANGLSRPATAPASAVRAALEMALHVWNEKLWKATKANAS